MAVVRRSPMSLVSGWLAIAALCAGVSACADNEFAARAAMSEEGGAEDGGGPPILHQMEGIVDSIAFRGVRRVIDTQGGSRLEQLEDVGADGSGQFAIELFQLVTLPSSVDSFSYEILFESSARFLWTMRDFRIRDAALAATNYTIIVLTDTPAVAGISCVRLGFVRNQPFGGRPGHYEADVDPSTGFVLAWREFDDAGAVMTEVAYETFAYGGDVSNMTLRGREFAAAELNLYAPLDPQAGFATRQPDLLPGGMHYAFAEVQDVPASAAAGLMPGEESELPLGSWLRLVATDGIEPLVFAHSELSASSSSTSSGGASAALAGVLRTYAHGSWEIGFGRIDGTSFVIAARGTEQEIAQVIGSAF